MQWAEPH